MSLRGSWEALAQWCAKKEGVEAEKAVLWVLRLFSDGQPGVQGCSHFSGVVQSVGAERGIFQPFSNTPYLLCKPKGNTASSGPAYPKAPGFL